MAAELVQQRGAAKGQLSGGRPKQACTRRGDRANLKAREHMQRVSSPGRTTA